MKVSVIVCLGYFSGQGGWILIKIVSIPKYPLFIESLKRRYERWKYYKIVHTLKFTIFVF